MAGGVVFATSLGSIHDPSCPHHPGESGHGSWYASVLHGEQHEEATSAEAHSHRHAPSSDEAPDDCTCSGGLCVLSVVAGPPVQTASEISFGQTEPDDAGFAADIVPTHHSERYLQPPGRGPPTVL